MATKRPAGRALKLDLSRMSCEQLDVIDQILTMFVDAAQTSYTRALAASRIDDTSSMYSNMASYWKNARGGLRWARGQFRKSRAAHERRNATAAGNGSSGAERPGA